MYGCIELINRTRIGEVFHKYINPRKKVGDAALNVHGISNEFLADKPLFADVADDLLEFIKDSKLVIHNAKFDIGFINNELSSIGKSKEKIQMNKVVDTLLLARKKYPGSPASLDALCKRFKISLDKRDKHGAHIDAKLLAMVYIKLTSEKQTKFSFQVSSLQESSKAKNIINFPSRTFNISDSEKTLHQNLVKTFANPIWNNKPS